MAWIALRPDAQVCDDVALARLRVGQDGGGTARGAAHQPGVGALERAAAVERQQQRDQVVDGDDDRAGPLPRRAPVGHERHIGAQPAAGMREGNLLEPELGQVGADA